MNLFSYRLPGINTVRADDLLETSQRSYVKEYSISFYKCLIMEIIRLYIHASARIHEKTFSSSSRSTFANRGLNPRLMGTSGTLIHPRGSVAGLIDSSGVGSMPAFGYLKYLTFGRDHSAWTFTGKSTLPLDSKIYIKFIGYQGA